MLIKHIRKHEGTEQWACVQQVGAYPSLVKGLHGLVSMCFYCKFLSKYYQKSEKKIPNYYNTLGFGYTDSTTRPPKTCTD